MGFFFPGPSISLQRKGFDAFEFGKSNQNHTQAKIAPDFDRIICRINTNFSVMGSVLKEINSKLKQMSAVAR